MCGILISCPGCAKLLQPPHKVHAQKGKKMKRTDYLAHLKEKGYTLKGENQVELGTLLFDIREHTIHTAMGEQRTFCLKLNPKSDINLCPCPWA